MKKINLYHIMSFVIGLIFLLSPCSAWSNKPIGDSTAVPELSSPATNTEARGENDSLKLNFETVIKEIFDKKKEEFKQTVLSNERLRMSGSNTSGDYIFDFNFNEEVKKYILFYKKKPNTIPEVTNEFDSIQAFKLLNLEINNWSKQSHNPDIYCVYIKVDEKMLWTSSLDAYNLGNKNESAVVKYLKENLETDSNIVVLTTFYKHLTDYYTFAEEFLNSRSTSGKGIFLNTYFCYDRLYKDSENKSDKILQQGYYNLFANEIIDTTKHKCVSILAASMRNDFNGLPEFKCFSAFVNAIMIVFDDKNNYKCDEPIDSSGGNSNSSIIVHNFTSESIDSLLSNLFEGREKKEYDDVGYRRDIKAVLILTDNEDDFAAADSVIIPNGYRKIWIHKENSVYSIKSLDADNYPGFEPLLGYLGISEALIVGNFIMEANYGSINEVATQTYLFLDMLAKGIRGLKIPDKYWNCDKPEIYNVYYQDIASYLMKPYVLPRQYLFNKLDLLSPKFKTLVDLQTDEAQFAFMCGMWGGLLEILAAIPDVLKIVPAVLSEQGRDEMAKVWNALSNYSKVDSVTMEKIHQGFGWAIVDGLSDQFDPTKPCKFSYNVAELAVPIVIALIPGGQGAGVSVAGKILNTFKSIIKFEDKINCISLVLNKTGSVAVRVVRRTNRHIAEVTPSNWFKNIRKKVDGKLEEETIDNDIFRAEYDEPSNTINGEELMDLNNPIVRNFSISNELIDLIRSNSKKFFSPDVLRQYNDLIAAIKGTNSINDFDDFLDQLEGTYPQLRQMMEEGRPFTERYFKYKYLDQLEELGISQSQLTSLTNKFPNKNFEIEILLCNIDPTNATALVDDLMTASVSFTNKLMGDGKLALSWEAVHNIGTNPAWRTHIPLLENLDDIISHPILLNKIGGKTKLSDILKKNSASPYAGCNCGQQWFPNIEETVEALGQFANKFNQAKVNSLVAGLSNSVNSLRRGAVQELKGIRNQISEIIDVQVSLPNTSRIADAQLSDGRWKEIKSTSNILQKVGTDDFSQLIAYIQNLTDINKLKYSFDKEILKAPTSAGGLGLLDDVAALKHSKDQMRLVFMNNAQEIFNANPTIFTKFDEIDDWVDLFELASSNSFVDNPIIKNLVVIQ